MKGKGKTQEQFLKEMEDLFGCDEYDFSKAVYTGARKPLEVVCKLHGSFYPMPTNLLKGRGCFKCGRVKGGLKIRKDNQFFIDKSKEVHGERYDYSKVVYTGNDKPVEIVCTEHGSFFQAPFSHYNGSGCPSCVRRIYESLEHLWEDIDTSLSDNWELLSVHDNFNFRVGERVEVLCKEHNNVFVSTFFNLLRRKSCCDTTRYEMTGDSQKTQASVYKKHIFEVHGNRYEYPNYPERLVTVNDKIDIECKFHGIFSQTLRHHIVRKQGCPECAKVLKGQTKTDNWKAYAIDRMQEVLISETKYSLVSSDLVNNSKDHFLFNCTIHGEFGKAYGNFMQGQRCPECNIFEGWGKSTYIERGNTYYEGKSNIYLIRIYNSDESFYKVGVTFHNDLRRRFTKFEMPYNYEKIMMVKGNVADIVDFETVVHRANAIYHYSPQIKFGGSVRECFTKEGLDSTIKMFNDFKEKVNV